MEDSPLFTTWRFLFTGPWARGTGHLVASDDGPHRVLRGQTRYEIKYICCGQHRHGDECSRGRPAGGRAGERGGGWRRRRRRGRSTDIKSSNHTAHASSQTVYKYCSKRLPQLLLSYHTSDNQPPCFPFKSLYILLSHCPCTLTICPLPG